MCKFTIAIPVYNGIKSIAKAVASGINQDYDFEFEVLVVDNNSNDGTAEILNSYSDKIEIVKNIKTVSTDS